MEDRQVNLADDQGTRPPVSQNREHSGWQDSPVKLEWKPKNEMDGLFDTGQVRRIQMEFASMHSITLKRATRRLRAFGSMSLATAEAPAGWRISPTIARDRGDYLLHTILGR